MMLQTVTFQVLTFFSSWFVLFQQEVIITDSESAKNDCKSHTAKLFIRGVPETVVRKCSVKKILLNIWQNPQENTYTRVYLFIKLQTEAYCYASICHNYPDM